MSQLYRENKNTYYRPLVARVGDGYMPIVGMDRYGITPERLYARRGSSTLSYAYSAPRVTLTFKDGEKLRVKTESAWPDEVRDETTTQDASHIEIEYRHMKYDHDVTSPKDDYISCANNLLSSTSVDSPDIADFNPIPSVTNATYDIYTDREYLPAEATVLCEMDRAYNSGMSTTAVAYVRVVEFLDVGVIRFPNVEPGAKVKVPVNIRAKLSATRDVSWDNTASEREEVELTKRLSFGIGIVNIGGHSWDNQDHTPLSFSSFVLRNAWVDLMRPGTTTSVVELTATVPASRMAFLVLSTDGTLDQIKQSFDPSKGFTSDEGAYGYGQYVSLELSATLGDGVAPV